MKIAFIGLGVMGYPMAGHQQQKGHDVCVYNRTESKARAWVKQYGGRFALTPSEASKGADCVMVCVGNDDDVRSVTCGEQGILESLESGTTLVDHTTTSHRLALELFEACKQHGVDFLDAPVSGGQGGAENGVLAVMIGGEQNVLERVEQGILPYAKSITLMGPTGAGQMTKMVNQILIAGVLQGISEGLTLARKFNLDLSKVVDVISGGAAGSWQLSNNGKSIVQNQFDFGFAIDWMVKDLGFCLDSAEQLGLVLPNTIHAMAEYKKLQAKGYNRCDTSVLIKQFSE